MKKVLKRIYNEEFARYIIAGVGIAVINFVVFYGLQELSVVYTVANIFAIIVSKTSGYFMNKVFVYRSHTESMRETFSEMMRFMVTRGVTGLLDFFGVIFLVEIVNIEKNFSKGVIIVFVILLNYILGKTTVFKK